MSETRVWKRWMTRLIIGVSPFIITCLIALIDMFFYYYTDVTLTGLQYTSIAGQPESLRGAILLAIGAVVFICGVVITVNILEELNIQKRKQIELKYQQEMSASRADLKADIEKYLLSSKKEEKQ